MGIFYGIGPESSIEIRGNGVAIYSYVPHSKSNMSKGDLTLIMNFINNEVKRSTEILRQSGHNGNLIIMNDMSTISIAKSRILYLDYLENKEGFETASGEYLINFLGIIDDWKSILDLSEIRSFIKMRALMISYSPMDPIYHTMSYSNQTIRIASPGNLIADSGI